MLNKIWYEISPVKLKTLKASFWKAMSRDFKNPKFRYLLNKTDNMLITPFQLMIIGYIFIILRTTMEYRSRNCNKNAANAYVKIIPHRWKLYSSELHDES